ncbi:MAG TPA: hypothetical protein VF101_06400 [Gaiellaceae bacterium]
MRCRRLSIAVILAVVGWLAAAPADANHIPGATYRGTHSGGGTVQFTVSADGTRVTSYGVFMIPIAGGGTCFAATAPEFAGIPIVNHEFAKSGEFVFTGSFPRAGVAQGTLAFRNAPSPCGTTATFTWTATAGSGPAPSPPPPPQPPPPPPPAATGPPYFRGGHDRVRLVRKSKTQVVVAARFRICEGGTPLRLFVTQRRRVSGRLVAESKFSRRLVGGKPIRELGGTLCRDYRTSWNLGLKLFGTGWITITLRVVDPAGRSSGAPQYAVRAPAR